MLKVTLLKKLHKLLWASDDMMDQEALFKAQELVDSEILAEAEKGNMRITQLKNGFIKTIKTVV